MKKIKFGTDGWRAIMADDFTFENVKLVVQAVAAYLREHPLRDNGVVIGYDNRFLSERFAAEAVKVMSGNGIKCFLINKAAPTPVVAYAITTLNAAGAVMITASHNSPESNGIKFIPEYAGPALPEITDQIEAEIAKLDYEHIIREISLEEAERQGLYQEFDPKPAYKKQIKQLINFDAISKANLKIIVDPMFGAGINYLDEILIEEGCQVTALHNYRDVLFGGIRPEPTPDELRELQERVLGEGADLGLALDGDADRFGVIDSNGLFITPNMVLAMLYYHLLNVRKCRGPVARSVSTTHLLDKMAEEFGYQNEETPVGFKYIGESMRKKGSVLGGEESGGLSIQGHIPEKDGILATLLIAEIRAVHGKTLTGIMKQIFDDYGYVYNERIDLYLDPQQKDVLLEELKSFNPSDFSGQPVKERILIDGIKIVLENGAWFLIRPSGTEPLMRIYVEADSEEQVKIILDDVRNHFGIYESKGAL